MVIKFGILFLVVKIKNYPPELVRGFLPTNFVAFLV